MGEYICTGHCEYCTIECATAGVPENESDDTQEFNLDEFDLDDCWPECRNA